MLGTMRTTVTLDDDTVALIHRRMRERGESFKTALNAAIRKGGRGTTRPGPIRDADRPSRVPRISLDRELQIAAELSE